MTTFTELNISPEIIKAMNDMGWTEPTPVQVAAIPVGLAGGDMFAQAQTGTGKTGAFGTIILERTKSGARAPTTLILVPTRELANQVCEELAKLARYTGHDSIAIYGGVGIGPQASKLRRGVDIVVACPGRAKDLLNQNLLDLSKVSVVVLDEADRMLDMGFSRDLNYILARVPQKRQSLLFSATMSQDIKKLAMSHMVKPKELLVSRDEPVLDLTKQHYMIVGRDDKRDALCTVLDANGPKSIVFCHTKHGANRLVKKLQACGYLAGAIHGNVSQNGRERVLKDFKDGSVKVLVATDVAARGLDIDAVDLVVNFDAPVDADTYVHRIGRTGRAGLTGTAVSLFLPEERNDIKAIERRTGKPIELLDIEIVRKPEIVPEPGSPARIIHNDQVPRSRPTTRPAPKKHSHRPPQSQGPRRDGNGGAPRNVYHATRQNQHDPQQSSRPQGSDGKRHLKPRNAGSRPQPAGARTD